MHPLPQVDRRLARTSPVIVLKDEAQEVQVDFPVLAVLAVVEAALAGSEAEAVGAEVFSAKRCAARFRPSSS